MNNNCSCGIANCDLGCDLSGGESERTEKALSCFNVYDECDASEYVRNRLWAAGASLEEAACALTAVAEVHGKNSDFYKSIVPKSGDALLIPEIFWVSPLARLMEMDCNVPVKPKARKKTAKPVVYSGNTLSAWLEGA